MRRSATRAVHGPFLNQGPALERARPSFLLLLALAILLFHAGLLFVFYPVAPEASERVRRRTTILLSEGDPGYENVRALLRQYAPGALIHPPEGVSYSALQGRMPFVPEYEPVVAALPDLVPHAPTEVPMVDFLAASAPLIVPKDWSAENPSAAPAAVSYPICFLNGLPFESKPFRLPERDAQDLQRNPPPRATILAASRAGEGFPYESRVVASCGSERLDFLAQGFWDRELNAHDCIAAARDANAVLEVVWSARIPGEPHEPIQEGRP